jgi:hypothetical protein
MSKMVPEIEFDALTLSAGPLIAQGYRVTSIRHRRVTRIDRPDWLEHMAHQMRRSIADFTARGDMYSMGGWCDHYRRVYSQDHLTVPKDYINKIPNSGWDQVSYIWKPGDDESWKTYVPLADQMRAYMGAKVRIVNGLMSWRLELPDDTISFNGGHAADYFERLFKMLGCDVTRVNENA